MQADSGIELSSLKVDGGATANNFLMQFQSDILGVEVARPVVAETTALGAAYLAGLAVKFWDSKEEIAKNWAVDQTYNNEIPEVKRSELYDGWKRAVERSRDWEQA